MCIYTHVHIFFQTACVLSAHPWAQHSEILTSSPVDFYANSSLTAESQIFLED